MTMAGAGTIKVGFTSGFNSPYGIVVDSQYKGTQLAVEQFNKNGGVLGRSVEIIPKDDKMDVKEAEIVAKELIEKEKVHALTGSLSADTQIVTNNLAKHAGILFISMSQSNEITQASNTGEHTFHESLTPYMTAQLLGKWGLEHLGKRWFFIISDYGWGHQVYASYKKILAQKGGEDLGMVAVPLGATEEDYLQVFPKVLEAKPDVLSATSFGSDQISFIRASKKVGMQKETSILLTLAELSIADVITPEEVVGLYFGANFYFGLEKEIASAKKFVDAYRERFNGELPTGYAGYGYSGTLELLTAINEVGEYPIVYDKVTQFLEGRSYDHYKGKQWWRPCDHQSFQDFYILRFKGPEESAHKYDIGEIIGTVTWDLDIERTCEELGHAEHQGGHIQRA